MKKIKIIAIILAIIIILSIIANILTTPNKKENISKNIQLDIKKCKITKEKDTHGGFLGDGEYFAQIKCKNVEETIEKRWKKIPLTETLKEAMNLELCDKNNCKNAFEKYNIPEITEGYYYFLDRHEESTNPNDDKNINKRNSYNFSIALYNKETKLIYYYELDT